MKKHLFLTALIFCILLISCSKDDDNSSEDFRPPDQFNSEVIISWYNLIKVLTTETSGYTPPVAARSFGYTGIALYESIQLGMGNNSLSGKLNDLSIATDYDENLEYHWPTVANTALAQMTKSFYNNASPENLTHIDNLEAQFNTQFENMESTSVLERSKLLALSISNQVLTWSNSDGAVGAQFNNFPADYSPIPGEAFWKPTADNGFTPALQPYWGENRPFITLNVQNTIPVAPPVYATDPSSVFYQRAVSVYEAVNNITEEQKVIAEFWSDDPATSATPPGHSISILNQLITENNVNLYQSSRAFGMLAIGISDAFISCWKVKYTTNYPRPITFINQYISPSWSPILITPPFPEYTSGHSVQSGALAEILTEIFGDSYTFIDRTHEDRTDIDGSPRTYSNFYNMAEEAAISRLYGGIHFQEAIDLGLEQGYQIGANVIEVFDGN